MNKRLGGVDPERCAKSRISGGEGLGKGVGEMPRSALCQNMR